MSSRKQTRRFKRSKNHLLVVALNAPLSFYLHTRYLGADGVVVGEECGEVSEEYLRARYPNLIALGGQCGGGKTARQRHLSAMALSERMQLWGGSR